MNDHNVDNGRNLARTQELMESRCAIASLALTKLQVLLSREEAQEFVEGLETLAKYLAFEASSLRLRFRVKDL